MQNVCVYVRMKLCLCVVVCKNTCTGEVGTLDGRSTGSLIHSESFPSGLCCIGCAGGCCGWWMVTKLVKVSLVSKNEVTMRLVLIPDRDEWILVVNVRDQQSTYLWHRAVTTKTWLRRLLAIWSLVVFLINFFFRWLMILRWCGIGNGGTKCFVHFFWRHFDIV